MTGINVYGGKCIYQIHKATPDLEILDASFQEKETNERKQLYTVRIYEIEVICIGEQNRFRFGSLPRSRSRSLSSSLALSLPRSRSLPRSLPRFLPPSLPRSRLSSRPSSRSLPRFLSPSLSSKLSLSLSFSNSLPLSRWFFSRDKRFECVLWRYSIHRRGVRRKV